MPGLRGRVGKNDAVADFDDRGRLRVKSLGRLNPVKDQTYFIRCCDFVKIGYAQDPTERLLELQPHNPFYLTLLAVIPGGVAVERGWHRKFDAFRHCFEWFRYEGELKAAIEALEPWEDPRRVWQREQMAAKAAQV